MTPPGTSLATRVGAARRVARTLGRPLEPLREIGTSYSVAVSNASMLPGLCARIGLQLIVARLVGRHVRHIGVSRSFGGQLLVSGPSGPGLAAVLLLPSLALVALGTCLALPIALETLVLETPVVPDDASADGMQRVVIERWLSQGIIPGAALWAAVSCFFAAPITTRDVERARDAVSGRARHVLFPIVVLHHLTDPLDRYLGVASNVVSVFAWAVIVLLSARVLW